MKNLFNKLKTIRKNNNVILWNIFMAFVIKGGSLIIGLFTMPAYMKYFDNNVVLGAWLTIVSVLSWILNFDMGIGNGLRNKLVTPLVKKDYESVKDYISSAYFSLTAIAIVIVIVGYFLIGYVDWNLFFSVSSEYISNDILIDTMRIVLVGTIIQFILRIITSILYALQKSFIPNMLHLISTILLVICIYTGLHFNINGTPGQNLVTLAYINILTVNIPLIIVTIVVFTTTLKGCGPKLYRYRKDYAHDVMKVGIAFLWLQIMFMTINNTNEFLITWFVGGNQVVEYQIYFKLFTLGGTIVSLALTPIWSAVTKAKVESNFIWINKLNNLLMLLGGIAVIFEFLIIIVLQLIINIWLGEDAIQVNYIYAIIFAISGSLFVWNKIISSMSNGFGELKIQTIFLTLGAFMNIPLAYIGSKMFDSYISIVLANIISLLPYCIVQPLWMKKYLKNKISKMESI